MNTDSLASLIIPIIAESVRALVSGDNTGSMENCPEIDPAEPDAASETNGSYQLVAFV
jgi:hypothetical protein